MIPKKFHFGKRVILRNTGDIAWQHEEDELTGIYMRQRRYPELSADWYPHKVWAKGRAWHFSDSEVDATPKRK